MTTIRIAEIRGKGIKKRCRKQDYIYVDGIGSNDEEALTNLQENVVKTIGEMKSYEFDTKIFVYDAEKHEWGSIVRPLLPWIHADTHNCIELSWDQFFIKYYKDMKCMVPT